MLRRLSVRGKILAALVVPVLVLVAMAAVIAVGAIGDGRTTQAVLAIGLAVVAVVASVAVALSVARRISRPLHRITDAADDLRAQLPRLVEQGVVPGQGPNILVVPIPVESPDEVGQLAAAFNAVNTTSIQVAREQAALRGSIAEMFVNVARRDQVLLNRQLAFLDDLERSEEDPNALANLFHLDHLATRMRRNAESLLVLAGIDSGRRVRQPMATSDVIRTASSEIELYDRVRLNLGADPMMLGHNALNAAHLLAELLENATLFSEPHVPVEVSTGRDAEHVLIRVRDRGLGMTQHEIAEANRKVSTTAASEVVGAQRLGLFVVGRLADRLGARVLFSEGSDGVGTEVVVGFPTALFVPDSSIPLPLPSEAAVRAAGATAAPVPGAVLEEAAFAARPPTSTLPIVQRDARAPVPVDLAALTDGITTAGMPRRRSRGVDPTGAIPSAAFVAGPQTGGIVLPPLAAPSLPLDLPLPDDEWSPPEVAAASPVDEQSGVGSLPRRSGAGAEAVVEPAADEVAVADTSADVGARSAMFSSFRAMDALEVAVDEVPVAAAASPLSAEFDTRHAGVSVHSSALSEPVAEPVVPVHDGAAPDLVVPDIELPDVAPDASTDDAWTPQFAFEPLAGVSTPEVAEVVQESPTEVAETRPVEVVAEVEPTATAAEESAGEAPTASEVYVPPVGGPVFGRVHEADALPAEHAAAVVTPEPAPAAFAEPAPVSELSPAVEEPPAELPPAVEQPVAPHEEEASTQEEIPEALTLEALPKFDELLVGLPTDRAVRDDAPRKRGLFGRRQRTNPEPEPLPASPEPQVFLAGPIEAAPAPLAPARQPYAVQPYAEQLQTEQPRAVQPYAPRPAEPVLPDASEPLAPAQPVVAESGFAATRPAFAEPPSADSLFGAPDRSATVPHSDVPVAEGPPVESPSSELPVAEVPAPEPLAVSTPEPAAEVPVAAPVEPVPAQVPAFSLAPAVEPAETLPIVVPAVHASEPWSRESAPAVNAAAPAPAPAPAAVVMQSAEPSAETLPVAIAPIVAPFGRSTASPPDEPPSAEATPAEVPLADAPAAPSGPLYAASAPLTRRPVAGPLEPLDPDYVADSVEARSDWMASAVLFEEMSTLMRHSDATAGEAPGIGEAPAEDAYRPATIGVETTGLARRARLADRDGNIDRFTAQIDRDPEQLRTRLSAFQSGNARGRRMAQNGTPPNAPPVANDLEDV